MKQKLPLSRNVNNARGRKPSLAKSSLFCIRYQEPMIRGIQKTISSYLHHGLKYIFWTTISKLFSLMLADLSFLNNWTEQLLRETTNNYIFGPSGFACATWGGVAILSNLFILKDCLREGAKNILRGEGMPNLGWGRFNFTEFFFAWIILLGLSKVACRKSVS